MPLWSYCAYLRVGDVHIHSMSDNTCVRVSGANELALIQTDARSEATSLQCIVAVCIFFGGYIFLTKYK